MRIRREHRTEVTEVTEGDSGGDSLFVDAGGFWRELCESGESIAQRSRRSQRGDSDWDIRFLWTPGNLSEKCADPEHRTGVTEVTEGDLGWGIRFL